MSFALHRPSTIAEAVALAGKYGSAARLVAGGTDLVIQINRKRLAPEHLIDLSGLPDLAGIEEDASGFVLGALTTHKTIEQHPAFQGELRALVEAARVIGGHQIRNVATVGGNIVTPHRRRIWCRRCWCSTPKWRSLAPPTRGACRSSAS